MDVILALLLYIFWVPMSIIMLIIAIPYYLITQPLFGITLIIITAAVLMFGDAS